MKDLNIDAVVLLGAADGVVGRVHHPAKDHKKEVECERRQWSRSCQPSAYEGTREWRRSDACLCCIVLPLRCVTILVGR